MSAFRSHLNRELSLACLKALFLFTGALAALASRTLASAGTTGATVLDFPVGARAIAMGEAYTAQADDISSLYWNPAGIAILNQSQASFMHNQAFQDQNYENIAVGTPLENGGIAGSLSYLSYGSIAGYDANKNPTGNVEAYSGVGTVGGGVLLGPLSLGANLKGIQEKLADVSATGFAGDLGGIYTFQNDFNGGTFRAGASVRNLGTGLKFVNQRDPLPVQVRLGVAAVQMLDRRLNWSLDFGKERDVKGAIYSGAEYWAAPMLALRVGYAGSGQEGSGLRAGVGLRLKDFSFDYAYSAYGDLGISHRYEVSMRFGVIRPVLTPEERKMLKRAKLAMEREEYSEAVLLLDSLRQMEPHYKLFPRLENVAMRGAEKQSHEQPISMKWNLSGGKTAAETEAEQMELTDLLLIGSDQDKKLQTAESSALAPYMPGSKAEKKR